MKFSDEVKERAFTRSRGRCECQLREHGHVLRSCGSPLTRDTAAFARIDHYAQDFTYYNCYVLCHECFQFLNNQRADQGF